MDTKCQSCEQPSRQGLYLCDTCYPDMGNNLDRTPDLMRSLTTTISKQAKVSTPSGKGKNDEQPLPLNVNAMDRKHQLLALLINLGFRISSITDTEFPSRKADDLAAYIRQALPQLRKHPDAGHWHNELTTAYRNGTNAIDRPAERISVGRCGAKTVEGDCPKELLVRNNQRNITCPTCGAQWDVQERQRNAINAAWDAISYPPVIVRALQQWDKVWKVSVKDIQNWAARGYLDFAAVDDHGRKMYRVSEVQKAAAEVATRRK